MKKVLIAFAVIGSVAVLATVQRTEARSAATAAEHRIRAIDKKWVAAVATKDPKVVVAFYAEDGAILPPGAPLAEGHDAIAKVWQGFFQLEDFSLTFAPLKIDVASNADMAYEIGTYSLSFRGDKGAVRDNGKYVVVWKKEKGAWKAAADIFNSNGATP